MPNNEEREYRSMEITLQAGADGTPSYRVDGYASTFAPYKLGRVNGVDVYERIQPSAFEGADMSDVVFRVDHQGPVYARTSNGSLELYIDEHGLGTHADLGRTSRSRQLFEDIAAGNYPKMSFVFKVAPGGEHFDAQTRTRVVDKIAKVFDVGPSSVPYNPDTELTVSARSCLDGVIQAVEEAERLQALELRRKRLKTKHQYRR